MDATRRRHVLLKALAAHMVDEHRAFYERLLRQLARTDAPVIPRRLFAHAARIPADATEDEQTWGATLLLAFPDVCAGGARAS